MLYEAAERHATARAGYDRHELVTYREQHAHVDGFGLDPTDPRWHTDGTYHVDHDHLVIAIKGTIEGYGPPAPGRTQSFSLRIVTALAEGAAPTVVSRTIQWSTKCHAPGTTPISENVDDDDRESRANRGTHPPCAGRRLQPRSRAASRCSCHHAWQLAGAGRDGRAPCVSGAGDCAGNALAPCHGAPIIAKRARIPRSRLGRRLALRGS